MADTPEHPDDPAGRPAADPADAPGPVDPGADAPGQDSPTDAAPDSPTPGGAVRLSELEHVGWRRAAAADKRGQVGAWVRSVVAAELTRRAGADVPPNSGDEASAAEPGAQIVLNDSVVRELSQQLVRVGSNLNQVTRLAHIEARDRGLDVGSVGRVVAVIDQTRATIAALDSRLEAMSRP